MINTEGTKVWAHRGASGYAPENTLEAFKKAEKMKADGVELDVQLTKDVRCILLSKRGVVLRSPFRKAFFLFHRPFFYDNWLSMTIHDRRFEGIPLVISFVVIYQ